MSTVMSAFLTDDGTEIFFRGWGTGRPVVLCHGWPLNADSWGSQQQFLADQGYRAIAHDRRGHGRSTQTWHGNDMDTYADDLACLITTLDLHDVTLVGFSTGGGEVVRYLGRYGSERVRSLVLVAAVVPFMLRTDDNPGGIPIEVFDALRSGSRADRAQTYRDLADGPFFGHNRPNRRTSKGIRDGFWLQAMQSGVRNAYECIAAFSATDFRHDLDQIDIPTLVIHGDDDQIVPIDIGGAKTVQHLKDADLIVYPGAPHGLTSTHQDQLNRDLLSFLNVSDRHHQRSSQ